MNVFELYVLLSVLGCILSTICWNSNGKLNTAIKCGFAAIAMFGMIILFVSFEINLASMVGPLPGKS